VSQELLVEIQKHVVAEKTVKEGEETKEKGLDETT